MRVSHPGGRPFVTNLEPNLEANQILNDQFRHCYRGIQLNSFIESTSMSWGLGTGLIVERESATLGRQHYVSTSLHVAIDENVGTIPVRSE